MTGFFEPGSANAYERQEIKDPEPPPGFVDNTVYVYRLDENGNKVLVRTEKAFPEPEKTENGKVKLNFSVKGKEKGVGTMAGKTKYDWVKIDPVIIKMDKAGAKLSEISKKVNIPVGTIYSRLEKIRQAEKSTTVPAAKLEAVKDEAQPATEIIIDIEDEEKFCCEECEEPLAKGEDIFIEPRSYKVDTSMIICPACFKEKYLGLEKQIEFKPLPGNFELENEEPIPYLLPERELSRKENILMIVKARAALTEEIVADLIDNPMVLGMVKELIQLGVL